jgi:hypothetical protein
MLISFACYLTWPKFDPASSAHVTFKEWIDGRPELRSVLSRMLRRWGSSAGLATARREQAVTAVTATQLQYVWGQPGCRTA